MAKHLELGKFAEEKAAEWFVEKFSAKLIHKNYLCKMGELDLVFELAEELAEPKSKQRMILVIVEVRMRTEGAMVDAVTSVGPKKLRRIQNTINHFLLFYRGKAQSIRLDILAGESVPGTGRQSGDRTLIWTHLPGIWL